MRKLFDFSHRLSIMLFLNKSWKKVAKSNNKGAKLASMHATTYDTKKCHM